MKILWIVNIVFPEAESLLSGSSVLKSSGGWMTAAARALALQGVKLSVAAVHDGISDLTLLRGEFADYYLIPYGRGNTRRNPDYGPYWKRIRAAAAPDIVHIHGTEFTHGLEYVRECGPDGVVVSIQGILTECAAHYFDGMSLADRIFSVSLRDILKRDTLFSGRRDFYVRAKFERQLLQSVRHVMGRTAWDRDFALSVNPSLQYHFCNETLRPEFYSGAWKHNGSKTVFVSQATYPIKGIHQLLKALSLMDEKPQVMVAGFNIAEDSTWWKRLKIRSYGMYLNRLIRRFGLQDRVHFTGPLDAAEMKEKLLTCDAFISPSSLENSSNSIGEAQLLGVPVIASRRGGTPSVVEDGISGFLYDFYDVRTLASLISQVLGADCTDLAAGERRVAAARHDAEANAQTLKQIYEDIYRNL